MSSPDREPDSPVPALAPNTRVSEAQRREIGATLLKLYDDGLSIREIAARTGYSIGRVRGFLIGAGVTWRSRGGSNRGRRQDTQDTSG